jgi:hypothetical protein
MDAISLECLPSAQRVNFEAGNIMVDRQLQREKKKGGTYILVSVKNDQPRKLNSAPFVMRLLKEQRANRRSNVWRQKNYGGVKAVLKT